MNNLENRKYIILLVFIVMGIVFSIRLGYLQVLDDTWKIRAANITETKAYTYPSRGIIYDRHGKKLVDNGSFYDLMIVPRKAKGLDTLKFCKLIGISKNEFIKRVKKAIKNNGSRKPSIIDGQLSAEQFAEIAEEIYQFQGVFEQKRTHRYYPQSTAPHVLGYLAEVNKKEKKKDAYYRNGDLVGKRGLEKQYEKELRGKRGVRYFLRDKWGKHSSSFEEGNFDTLPIPGKNLTTTIDLQLQQYGERLMSNKKGSIVAIEPRTGEILCLISAPAYDPNLLVGKSLRNNYLSLQRNDSLTPLFNRALESKYPPGSIFKIPQSLIGLQIGAFTLEHGVDCDKIIGCHNHPSAQTVQQAIQFSCNPYYYYSVRKMIQRNEFRSIFKDAEVGLGKWQKRMEGFGFGTRFDIDFPGMKRGNIPGPELYNKIYGKGRWAYSTIYSISIGQGEVEVVPVQMANLAAVIANKGYYHTPHFIRSLGDEGKPMDYMKKINAGIDEKWFEPVHEAMRWVVEVPGGTARRARLDSVTICGKTGTVENPHGADHSVFIAFAPRENPKIAIAVYVENAEGGGGKWAAPIVSLMIEKYLFGEVKRKEKEQKLIDQDFINH